MPPSRSHVIFLLEDFAQSGNAHRDSDHLLGVAEEVCREAVVLGVVGD